MAATRSSRAPKAPESSPADGLGTVILVHGPEELFRERAVSAVLAAVRKADPDADRSEIDGATLAPGALIELTSPSLFATQRAVIVRGAEGLPPETADALVAYAKQPQPDVALVVVHPGGVKGKGVVDKLRKAGARVVACESLKSWDLPKFVVREVRQAGGKIGDDAAALLVDAIGSDLRALAGAVSQLLSDTGNEPVSEDLVRRYFAGRAEVTSFAVADSAITGRTAQALEQLRWALRSGVAPVLVTSAMASGLRGLVKLSGAPRRVGDGELAKIVGVPPWKLKSLRGQLRGWSSIGLATAIEAVAQADADIKGASDDAGYALERAVLAVSNARSS
jgi:DNA polymerase-3 subunit delta